MWLVIVGTGGWGVCFRWIGRISVEQDRLTEQLREQGRRIERISKIERDLIKEAHPQVGQIKSGIDEMIATVKENAGENIIAVRESAARADPAAEGEKRGGSPPPSSAAFRFGFITRGIRRPRARSGSNRTSTRSNRAGKLAADVLGTRSEPSGPATGVG